ncbi:MAG: hypothetical protein JRD04_08920, partial [Deltaproteobacteria bacterium]|nr:hypothetical protein [Deltaproteobacteria bacterium]
MVMNTEANSGQYSVWESSSLEEEMVQFQLLEEKVDSLIAKIMALKSEKEALEKKF